MPELGLAIVAFPLPDDEELEEMVSYGKNVTGIDNTVFISPKGNARHGPGLKVAIDPPNSVSPHGKNASISFDGATVGEPIPRPLYDQVMQFIERNHDVLVDYWEYRILTDELQGRLRHRVKERRQIIKTKTSIHPGGARNLLVTLRGFLSFVFGNENPAAKVKAPTQRSLGYRTWDEANIAEFEKRWPIGPQERLAFALALYTRRSDLVKLGRQHIRQGSIHLVQTKRTRRKKPMELSIPIHPDLQKALDATPADHLTFLISRRGGPFSPGAFTL